MQLFKPLFLCSLIAFFLSCSTKEKSATVEKNEIPEISKKAKKRITMLKLKKKQEKLKLKSHR